MNASNLVERLSSELINQFTRQYNHGIRDQPQNDDRITLCRLYCGLQPRD